MRPRASSSARAALAQPAEIRLPTLLVVAGCLALSTLVFPCLSVQLGNLLEFSFSPSEALPYLIALAGLVAAAVVAPLALLRRDRRARAVAFALGIATAAWVQGNLLLWDYGKLDGTGIDWQRVAWRGWIDLAVWAAVLALFLVGWRGVSRNGALIASLLLGVQVAGLAPAAWSVDRYPSYLLAAVDEAPKFRLSSSRNLIVIVLDGLLTTEFGAALEEDPSLAEGFDGFTYFRNAVADFPITHASLPALLTARRYDSSEPYLEFIERAYSAPSSLPRILLEAGYRVDLYAMFRALWHDPRVMSNLKPPEQGLSAFGADLGYLLDLGLFRTSPQTLKRVLATGQRWPLSRAARALGLGARSQLAFAGGIDDTVGFGAAFTRAAAVTETAPVFKVYHLQGPHPPLRINEQGLGDALPMGPANYRRAVIGSVRVALSVLADLERLGVSDRSLVFLVSDHGFDVPVRPPEGRPDRVTELARALPLVLVKPIGERGPLRVSDAPVQLSDLPRTAVELLGLDPSGMPGENMMALRADSARRRTFWHMLDTNWRTSRYLSVMTEYAVTGLSWLAGSWRPTGQVLGSYSEALEAFRRLEELPSLGELAAYSGSGREPGMILTNRGELILFFPTPDPEPGEVAGVSLELKGLERGRRYRLALDVGDRSTGAAGGRVDQRVWLDGRLIHSRELAGDGSAGASRVTSEFLAEARRASLRIELRALDGPLNGSGSVGRIGVANLRLEPVED